MISYKLFTFFLWQFVERVELTSKITSVVLKSFSNSGHYLNSLCVSETWSKRIVGEVTTNTNTSWNNQFSFIFRKRWALKLISVHIWGVFSIFGVFVVHFHDLIKEWSESNIWIMWASIATNSRVNILSTRQDALLKWHARWIFFTLTGIPNLFC